MRDSEVVFDRLISQLLAREDGPELARPILKYGSTWILMVGPHTEDWGFCWCQPRVENVTCANASHWHMPDCECEERQACVHHVFVHQDQWH